MSSLTKMLKQIGSSSIMLYAVVALFIYMTLNVALIYHDVRLKVMNRMRPDEVTHLVNLIEDPASVDYDKIARFRYYYQSVVDSLPERADSWGLLGFSAYHLGDHKKAIEAYKQSIKVKPDFFWTYHNLGLIYYNQQDYPNAAIYLKQAVNQDPKSILKYVTSSIRLYVPILIARRIDSNKEVYDQTQLGYIRCLRLLALAHYFLEDYEEMLTVAKHAIDTNVDHTGTFHFYAGLALSRLNKPNSAMYFYQESLKKDENRIDVYEQMAFSLKQTGQRAMVQVAILKVKQLREEFPDYQSLLKKDKYPLEIY